MEPDLIAFLPDGTELTLEVPSSWNVSLFQKINWGEYSVRLLLCDRLPRESEYSIVSLETGGPTVGYVISGTAVLSGEVAMVGDGHYCAYNAIIASVVCAQTRNGNFTLANPSPTSSSIFRAESLYMVTWDRYLLAPDGLASKYGLSLMKHGLIESDSGELPIFLPFSFDGKGGRLVLKENSVVPEYVNGIMCSLAPYASKAVFRFFYLYQVVEWLMGIELQRSTDDLRNDIVGGTITSFVEFKDRVDRFKDAMKEKTRINKSLTRVCVDTDASLDKLLCSIGILEQMCFAEKVYRIRNVLFHEYPRAMSFDSELDEISKNFFAYLVDVLQQHQ